MSSTDAREQAGEAAVPDLAAPGGAGLAGGQGLPVRRDVPVAGEPAGGEPLAGGLVVAGYRRRRRGWIVVVVVVVVAAAGVAGADAAGAFGSPKPAVSTSGYATSTAAVTRGSLTEQTPESGTLGDAGSYPVVVPASPGSGAAGSGAPGGGAAGSGSGSQTFTWLPAVGQIIRQGHQIYQVSGVPVLLLYGSVPAYRDLSEGMTGADVRQLNTDLVRLGYASPAALGPRSGWDYFSAETAYALGLLQTHAGLTVTGTLPLGQAVFLPGAVQVASLGTGAVLGGSATAGATVLTASSLTPVVTLSLDASLQTEVAAGDKVSVTLPDGSLTPGVISSVSVASAASSSSSSSNSGSPGGGQGSGSSGSGSGGSGATITVVVSLTDPKVAKGLNQVPVQVTLTTGSVSNVLVVPVEALLAEPGGGYAVEVTGPGGHHLVKVSPGLFDDAAGTVQVTGNLTPGQRVVVPGI
jgi:Putative peptidoglycan binding domain